MKTLNEELDELLNSIELPTDQEIRKETANVKISQTLKGRSLEDIIGKEKAEKGRLSRKLANKGIDYSERIKKTVQTKKKNGYYQSNKHGMNGRNHKESTRETMAIKAKIRQEIKAELGLGKNDLVPKDLLLERYKLNGLK